MTYRELIIDLLDLYPDLLDTEVETEISRYDGSIIRIGKVKWIGLDDDGGITLCCGSGYKTINCEPDTVVLARRAAKERKNKKLEKAKTAKKIAKFNKGCADLI